MKFCVYTIGRNIFVGEVGEEERILTGHRIRFLNRCIELVYLIFLIRALLIHVRVICLVYFVQRVTRAKR